MINSTVQRATVISRPSTSSAWTRHTYDAVVTSVVITVITTEPDGNTSAATRTVETVDWSASFAVSEVDVGGNASNMNGRTAADSGVISAPRDPQSRTISVGSGSCRVDMSFTVFAELQ